MTGNRAGVIDAKINTRKEQINSIGHLGPLLLGILGIFGLALYIVPGIILLGLAYWWSMSRENERVRLENEIKELEAERL